MKRKHTRSDQLSSDDEPQIDISSLVDVSFLLLIFFLVTATIVKKEQDLGMKLPVPGARNLSGSPLVVQLQENGEIVVNPNDYPEVISKANGGSELEPLAGRLRLLKAGQGNDASVMLQVSNEVNYQRFIDVINCLVSEKIDKLAVVDFIDDTGH